MSININDNIMDALELLITSELKRNHLMGEVEISTSPITLYIKPKKSDTLFSFELNKSNDTLIYSNSFFSKNFDFNSMIKSTCKEIIKNI